MFKFHDYALHHYQEQLRAEYRRNNMDVDFLPFYQDIDFIPIAAGATADSQTTTDQDGDFIVTQTTHDTRNAATAANVFQPNLLVRLTEGVSGRHLEDRPVPVGNIFGNGQRAYLWPRPWFLGAKTSIIATLTNIDGANAFNVRLTFGGFKAIPRPLQA